MRLILTFALIAILFACTSEKEKDCSNNTTTKYEANWNSLQKHDYPQFAFVVKVERN